jgi:hypothetical protein
MSTNFYGNTNYFVYDLTDDFEIYGDTLFVWTDAIHPLILPHMELWSLIPDLRVNIQFDAKNNRIYGDGPPNYGRVVLADFNADVGERWEMWRYRQEFALEDNIVYREIRQIRDLTINGINREVIDIMQYTDFKYEPLVQYHSFASGIGYIGHDGCSDCYGIILHASKINGVVNGDITVSNEDDRADTPDNFRLDAAYPNPFNPTTTLRFALLQSGEVSLAVYDVLGRQVLTQNLGAMYAGEHRHALDMSGQPSGTYLVRMQSGGQVRSTRITLVK